jgi:3-oxoacyl-[acyl-carrier protein] reductase
MIMKNKVVVITGASRGIGRATALLMAKRGAHVVANYHQTQEAAESLLKEMSQYGDSIIVQGDISQPADIEKLYDAAMKKFGRTDILINNAGVINSPNAWADFTPQSFTQGINTNLFGPMHAVRIFTQALRQTQGNIINISSTFGIMGGAPVAVYTVAKAALINYTKSMAVELGPHIRVNAFAPGIIDTDMTAGAPKEFLEEMISRTPLKRLGTPAEMASCIAFLASDEASFVTGHTFIADGGHILMN